MQKYISCDSFVSISHLIMCLKIYYTVHKVNLNYNFLYWKILSADDKIFCYFIYREISYNNIKGTEVKSFKFIILS